jgi:CDP-diglyceride synthetase
MAFTLQNVQRLKTLSWSLLFLAADFGFIMCYVPSFSKLLCMIILLLGVFCARILAYLVGKAIEYKEDVDLTV